MMNHAINLDPKYLDIIVKILRTNLPPNDNVYVFGSRVTGRAKPFSDVDLLVDVSQPLTLEQLSLLNNEFDQSLLPYKVDIVDANSITESFRLAIQEQLVSL